MDDTVRNVTSHVTQRGTSHGTQQGVTVADAAVTLGLSPEAVRARLRRGTLDGYKAEDDTWRVRLPRIGSESHNPIQPTSQSEIGSQHNEPITHTDVTDVTPPLRNVTHHDTSHEAQHGTQRDVPDDALVTHLQEEVAYLRERLEDAMGQLAEERRRADVLRLGASVSTPEEPPIETYRAHTDTSAAGLLARLRRWLTGAD